MEEKHYPQYKGDGVAIWINADKNGQTYLSVAVLGGKAINCFKYEPKPKEEAIPRKPVL